MPWSMLRQRVRHGLRSVQQMPAAQTWGALQGGSSAWWCQRWCILQLAAWRSAGHLRSNPGSSGSRLLCPCSCVVKHLRGGLMTNPRTLALLGPFPWLPSVQPVPTPLALILHHPCITAPPTLASSCLAGEQAQEEGGGQLCGLPVMLHPLLLMVVLVFSVCMNIACLLCARGQARAR